MLNYLIVITNIKESVFNNMKKEVPKNFEYLLLALFCKYGGLFIN